MSNPSSKAVKLAAPCWPCHEFWDKWVQIQHGGSRPEEQGGHTLWVICCLDLDLSVLAFVVGSVAGHPPDTEKTHMEQNFLRISFWAVSVWSDTQPS